MTFLTKMRDAGCEETSIRAFARSYQQLADGASGMLPEALLQPVLDLPHSVQLPEPAAPPIQETVVIKLNGGLGTSMGLTKAKSLLRVRGEHTFLDLIARQVLYQRERFPGLRFLLMNSFSTVQDTRAALPAALGDPQDLDFLQNRVPKLLASDHTPLCWPNDPKLEWCPPGHGDLYVALFASGRLDELLEAGVRYAFVSNSDNLGATLDPAILEHFANSGAPFLMEVTRRTVADRKGGHLAKQDGHLVLRESAMCAPEDQAHFQDIERHRFFNTNNLWLRLDHLRDQLHSFGGVLPLPVIQNRKRADPRDPTAPWVLQLETAMGSAIGCFEGASAIEVPRHRFAPVKRTADLLAVRSDAYTLTHDHRIVLASNRPPVLDLDPTLQLVDALDEAFEVPPSLVECRRLHTRGPIVFQPGTVFKGDVSVVNASTERKTLAPGHYVNTVVSL